MDKEELKARLLEELEEELTWRVLEFTQIENVLHEKETDSEFCGIYRKSLIIMLYSYFEGYCKSALSIYAEYVNSLNLCVNEVTDGLACLALGNQFNKLLDSNYKPVNLGHRSLREDSVLQAFGRRKEFSTSYIPYISKNLVIPDDIIDTDSNLKSYVLKKILFRLDMDFTVVDDYQTEINELVNKRNAYAHGDKKRPPEEHEYNLYKAKTYNLMKLIRDITYDHFCNEKYLRENPAAG